MLFSREIGQYFIHKLRDNSTNCFTSLDMVSSFSRELFALSCVERWSVVPHRAIVRCREELLQNFQTLGF